MNTTFLKQVVERLVSQHDSFEDVHLILPGRRAIVYAREAFLQKHQRAGFLPSFHSLEDFILEHGNLKLMDSIDSIIELFRLHRIIEKDQAEPFDTFISWGGMLLQDFNEIDRYQVDGNELFDFLTEAKAIENWNPDGEPLSDFQLKYLKFYRQLATYYRLFRNRLIERGCAYQGLLFRKFSESLESQNKKWKQFEKIYFIGFNALTTAEQKIMDFFVQNEQGVQFRDADAYYMEDSRQEAGMFLRRQQQRDGDSFELIGDELLQTEKSISIYGVSGNVAQAKLVGNCLSQMDSKQIEKTALVMADENLLIPCLESIPAKVEKMNITMGYPLSNSSTYHWLLDYLMLYRSLEMEKQHEKSAGFILKELALFLRNRSFAQMGSEIKTKIDQLLYKLEQQKQFRVTADKLTEVNAFFDHPLFTDSQKEVRNLVEGMRVLLLKLQSRLKSKANPLQMGVLNTLDKHFNSLEERIKKIDFNLQLEGLVQLYRQILGVQTVDFVGEPLGGLQIMGVLESRTLDFEHVIFSSLNEGILPSGKSHNSFIPLDIKRKFKLPSYREKDAIFAYHFYRLLQKAKTISLIYNTQTDLFQSGEKSRFLEQLIVEMPKKNPKIKIRQAHYSPVIHSNELKGERIIKSPEIIEKIHTYLKSGLSPSSIAAFVNCPLDFYYKYILGLKEVEDIEAIIPDHLLGSLVHDTLEAIYSVHLNRILDLKSMAETRAKVKKELRNQFYEKLHHQPDFGYFKLAFEVAKQMVLQLLKLDEKSIQNGNEIQLIALEQKLEASLSIPSLKTKNAQLKIKGKVDRIDRLNGNLRIIDYKTGSVNHSDLSFKAENLLGSAKSKAIQLLIYQFLYESNFSSEPIKPGIISLKNISSGFIPLVNRDTVSNQEVFKEILNELIETIIDNSKDFIHNESSNYCNFCSMNNI